MKLAASAFLLILLYAHRLGNSGRLLAQPLSMFRDGEESWVGYELFALLLLVGALYTAALTRADREAEAVFSGVACLLLLIVALTPSLEPFHLICSALLLLFLFGYYAVLLYRAKNSLFIAHLAVPLALVLATGFHSYGIWQKTLIVYFVLASVAHHHVLRPATPAPPARDPQPSRSPSDRRRKVFSLEPGRAWMRRRTASSSSAC
jgi:hypothetical protein